MVDSWLSKYVDLVNKTGKKISKDYPGLGSCAGLTLPLMSFCNTTLELGGPAVIKINHIEESIKNSDIIVTGEGQIDDQTPRGKAPIQIANVAKKYGKPVIDISGRIDANAYKNNAMKNMTDTAEQVFRVVKTLSDKK